MKLQKNADELTPPQDLTPEESEEGSNDESALWSLLWSSELNASEGTNIKELTPAVSEDHHPFLDLSSGCQLAIRLHKNLLQVRITAKLHRNPL